MSNYKRVLKHLNKEELSTQKVELAAIDDLKKLNNTYFSDTDSANSIIKGLLSDARRAESKIESALKSVSKLESLVSKVEQSAKELGVNPNNIKELQESSVALKDSREYSQILSKIKKSSY